MKSTEQLLSGFVEEGIASLRFWNLMCLRIELTPREGKKTLVFLTEYIVQFSVETLHRADGCTDFGI